MRPARLAFLRSFVAAAFLALAAAEVILHVALPETSFHDDRLSLPARLALLGTEISLLAVFALAVFAPVGVLLERAASAARRLVRAAAVGAAVLVVWALLYLLAASWSLHAVSTYFLDLATLKLFAGDWRQMMQHAASMTPYLYVAVPAITLALSLLACAGLPRALRRLEARGRERLELAAVAVVAAAALAWAAGEAVARSDDRLVRDPLTSSVTTRAELFVAARSGRTGPLAHAASAAVLPGPEDLRVERGGIPVVRRPTIPMSAWVEEARRGDVRPLNVLVILLESLRPDQLRVYGGARDVMPNLDALGREGLVFEDVICHSSYSAYADPCPLSSQYPLRARDSFRFEEDVKFPRVLFYDLLRPLGWRTGIFSSQNEYWGGMYFFLDTGNVEKFLHAQTYAGQTYVNPSDEGFAGWVKGKKRAGKILDSATVDEAIAWIDEVRGEPFCFYMNLQQSHAPYDLPPGVPRRFAARSRDFAISFSHFPREQLPLVKDMYADALFYMDVQLGRLFDHLKQRGLWDSTAVIVTGDNGEAFFEHGVAAHAGPLYDEAIKVPLVVRAPGLAPGVDERPAQHVDVPPTICDLVGIPPHPSFQGVSLLASEWNPERSRYAVVQLPSAHQYAILRGRFKLIFDRLQGSYQLYDLVADPGETRDVLDAHPVEAEALKRRLDAWYFAQVEYYEDPSRFPSEYPPVVAD